MFSYVKKWLRSFDNPRVPLGQSLFGIPDPSPSGFVVDLNSVMGLPALKRAVQLIASRIATCPPEIYKRGPNGSRDKFVTHPSYRLVKTRPSPLYDRVLWLQATMLDVLLNGESFTWIIRDGVYGAVPVELLRIDPQNVHVEADSSGILYQIMVDGQKRTLLPQDCLHFRNLGSGVRGLSVVQSLKDVLGLQGALVRHGSQFFSNACTPTMVIESPVTFKNDDEEDKFLTKIERRHAGLNNSHRPMLLRGGMKASTFMIDPQTAQLLESKQFGLIEVANAIGISAQKLGAAIATSYGSLEQERLAFLEDLIPWIAHIQEELSYKLLTEDEKGSGEVYIEFDLSDAQATTKKEEADVWIARYNAGLCSFNEYRQASNLSTSTEPWGDWHRMAANLVFIEDDIEDTLEQEPAAEQQQEQADPAAENAEPPAVQDQEQGQVAQDQAPYEQRLRDLVRIDLERQLTRLRKAVEGTGPLDLDAHRDVFKRSLPWAGPKIDAILDELQAVLPEQRRQVLDKVDLDKLTENVCKS